MQHVAGPCLVSFYHNVLDPGAIMGDIRVDLIVTVIAVFVARLYSGHKAHSLVHSILIHKHCAPRFACKWKIRISNEFVSAENLMRFLPLHATLTVMLQA